jgi:hypothetical protein
MLHTFARYRDKHNSAQFWAALTRRWGISFTISDLMGINTNLRRSGADRGSQSTLKLAKESSSTVDPGRFRPKFEDTLR